jgi:hypothetical protein
MSASHGLLAHEPIQTRFTVESVLEEVAEDLLAKLIRPCNIRMFHLSVRAQHMYVCMLAETWRHGAGDASDAGAAGDAGALTKSRQTTNDVYLRARCYIRTYTHMQIHKMKIDMLVLRKEANDTSD